MRTVVMAAGLASLSLFSSAAHAEWMRLITSRGGAVWYMDPDRIKKVGGKTQAWVKIDHTSDRSVSWRETLQMISFDCPGQKYRMLSYVAYDTYGKTVGSKNQPDYGYGVGYDPIIPDSVMESVAEVACYEPSSTANQ
jgi:hypothetical protein